VIRKPLSILAMLAGIVLIVGRDPTARALHAAFSRPVIHVGIVLFPGVEPIDYAGPYEVFAQAGFAVATVSADGRPVTGMGLKVAADYSFANAPPFDILVVPGGSVRRAEDDPALLAFIRQRSGKARQVLSVCTGAYVLAATGLLNGLEATTYTESARHLADVYPRIHVVTDARWVDDGKIVTSAGLTTGIAAALHVVAKLKGLDDARTIAMRLEYPWQANPEAGFVRGDMADKYIPDLSGALPKDAHVAVMDSSGSVSRWRIRARIDTRLAPRALLARIDEAVGRTPGWQAQPSRGPHHWTKLEGGKLIRMSFASAASRHDGAYDLDARVRVQASGHQARSN
jgi:putative intracellular protease/amidase